MAGVKNSTGCPVLDKAGITSGHRYKGSKICLDCPDEKACVLDSQKERKRKLLISSDKEVFVMCKTCGAAETLTIRKGKLLPAERWQQKGNKIRHMIVCGEAK